MRAASLTFEAPDLEAFPSLKIAMDCGRAGGTLPCSFNAANEEAVNAFFDGKIKYLDIPFILRLRLQSCVKTWHSLRLKILRLLMRKHAVLQTRLLASYNN